VLLLSAQTAAEQPARRQPSMQSSRTQVALAVGLVATGVEMGVELRILIGICCRMDWIACSSSATKNLEEDQVAQSNDHKHFPIVHRGASARRRRRRRRRRLLAC
jgi:hypothetical protein